MADNVVCIRCEERPRAPRRRICYRCRDLQNADWYVRNRERHQRNQSEGHRRRKYGLSPEAFEGLAASQGGACLICSVVTALVVDHDHDTGRVRGLLCDLCNKGLGQFRDNPVALRAAADYLVERHAG